MLTFNLIDDNTNMEGLNIQAGITRLPDLNRYKHDKNEIMVTTNEIEEHKDTFEPLKDFLTLKQYRHYQENILKQNIKYETNL